MAPCKGVGMFILTAWHLDSKRQEVEVASFLTPGPETDTSVFHSLAKSQNPARFKETIDLTSQ